MIIISDLVDIYQREVTTDSLALRNIGKRISGKKDIQIEFNNHNDAAFTDGRNICIPHFCRSKIKIAQGFVAHESGHIGYGSFEIGFLKLIKKLTVKYDLPAFFVKHLVNVLEDVRVNELNKKEFPGFYKHLREYTIKLLPKIKAKIKFFENIFLYINLFMENYPDYQKKPHFPRFPLSDKDWETIKTVKAFLLKALTPNASIIAADQLCKVLIKYFKFKKKDPPPSKPNYSASNRKYFERGVYMGKSKKSSGSKVILLPNQFEEFFSKEIEEKNTNFNKSSSKMIDKIHKIDITAEDLKELTKQIKGIEGENKNTLKQEIGDKIEKKLKQASKRVKKEGKSFKELRKSLEKVYKETSDPHKRKREQNRANEFLRKHIETKKVKGQERIKRKKKRTNELKEILNEVENLERESNPEKKTAKKESLKKKIGEYRKRNKEEVGITNYEKAKKEDVVLDELLDTIREDNNNSKKNTQKREQLVKSLKDIHKVKEKAIRKTETMLREDLNELEDIIKTLEYEKNSSNSSEKGLNSREVLTKLKSYEEKLKKRGEKFGINPYLAELREIREDKIQNKKLVVELVKDVNQARDQLKSRLIKIGNGVLCLSEASSKEPRKVIETRIENDKMEPIKVSYAKIKGDQRSLITKMKLIFENLKKSSDFDNYQKRGRLNKNFIKAVTSNYSFKKCFTRRINQQILKILLLIDISGSMRGRKLVCAKISMIILTEALKELADIRIVLFTGNYDAKNILVKDFGEPLVPNKIDKVGCHQHIKSNLDGLSMEHEAEKLRGNELIIVISDGQPAGYRGYGLREAMDQIQKVRKRFKVFAFSIDAKGDYLDKLYGKNNWILTKSAKKTDLVDKIMKFSRLVVNEFY